MDAMVDGFGPSPSQFPWQEMRCSLGGGSVRRRCDGSRRLNQEPNEEITNKSNNPKKAGLTRNRVGFQSNNRGLPTMFF